MKFREETDVDEGIRLDAHHRATVEKIFRHPLSHNIEWHSVLSLLESLTAVTREHDGRLLVSLGGESETFDRRGRTIDEQQVVDLRRMLRGSGIVPEAS